MSTSKKEDPRTVRSREMFKNAVFLFYVRILVFQA